MASVAYKTDTLHVQLCMALLIPATLCICLRRYSEYTNPGYTPADAAANVAKSGTGHFTAVVWKSTTHLGCGYSYCQGRFIYVCNYYPSGKSWWKSHRSQELPARKASHRWGRTVLTAQPLPFLLAGNVEGQYSTNVQVPATS